MRFVRLAVWTVLGALLGAALAAAALIAFDISAPPVLYGFVEIGTAWLVLAAGAFYACQCAREMAKYGISKRREQLAGIWFGSELVWASLGVYVLSLHHQQWGTLAGTLLGIAAGVIFTIGCRRPVEQERGQLALIDTRGGLQRWWWS